MTALRDLDLCFIDIETTGHVIGYHEIVEVGAVRTSRDASYELATFQTKVRPDYPERATKAAVELTGFCSAAWGEASSVLDAMRALSRVTAGAVAVCHNPPFDRAFLQLASRSVEVELGLDYHWIGTESMAWRHYKEGMFESIRLNDLCSALGVEKEPVLHNALDGARACLRVYKALVSLASPRPLR